MEAVQKKGLLSRPTDLLLSLGLLACMGLCVLRGMVRTSTSISVSLSLSVFLPNLSFPLPLSFPPSQVVLDCAMDACFNYVYQYEPCLKDPVGFPRLTVGQPGSHWSHQGSDQGSH